MNTNREAETGFVQTAGSSNLFLKSDLYDEFLQLEASDQIGFVAPQ